MNIWDEFAAEEAARLEQARREIAAEKAAWNALTLEQQAASIAAREAKFADVPDSDEDFDEDFDEDEEDEQ